MSFSLGFDELPNSSYQSGANEYHVNSVSGVASSAGEDSYSTTFSPNASSGISNDLKSMLESNKEGLKVSVILFRSLHQHF
jgi:hypothetical protein